MGCGVGLVLVVGVLLVGGIIQITILIMAARKERSKKRKPSNEIRTNSCTLLGDLQLEVEQFQKFMIFGSSKGRNLNGLRPDTMFFGCNYAGPSDGPQGPSDGGGLATIQRVDGGAEETGAAKGWYRPQGVQDGTGRAAEETGTAEGCEGCSRGVKETSEEEEEPEEWQTNQLLEP